MVEFLYLIKVLLTFVSISMLKALEMNSGERFLVFKINMIDEFLNILALKFYTIAILLQ